MRNRSNGFGTPQTLVVILVLLIVVFAGWFVWHSTYQDKTLPPKAPAENSNNKKASSPGPYAGWKTAVSTRAGFSIKYPSNWVYNETLGSKDNVEHITIDSSKFHITIDSYEGTDINNSGKVATSCTDCLHTISSIDTVIPKLGAAQIKVVTYKLDNGQGNALVLELPNSTYYIPSPSHQDVKTSFRAISMLDSEQAYQNETADQFMASTDFTTARKVFESIQY